MKNCSRLAAEEIRLIEDRGRLRNWKRWGPYLSERQWATVREDYSPHGNCWDYFPHDHARSRAYRWGEDGLLGFTDRQCRLCFGLALWNGRDPILKERLFGLTGPEGNHGEDVKECYYYLDSTPTHSYAKALYKYPQAEFPYARLVHENRERGLAGPELELADTGIFDEDRYFDVFAEYAKASPEDTCIRITIANRGPEAATIHVLPTLWFRNTWSWGGGNGATACPSMRMRDTEVIRAEHDSLGAYLFAIDNEPGRPVSVLFTENETNTQRLWSHPNATRFVKDAFHEYVVFAHAEAVNPAQTGTKCAPHFVITIKPGMTHTLRLRLVREEEAPKQFFGKKFDTVFADRKREADEFYAQVARPGMSAEAKRVARQGYAGLLWSKQFYHYVIEGWLRGDPAQPQPPADRLGGRNREWPHLYSQDIISMPDKWEYPWFAAWDLAFHMIPMAQVDPDFAKHQLQLFLREWYMHPNGQIPAYEFAFGDVNPPVHAWAAWRVYKISGKRGERDRAFLESVFQKLLLNFTWWVNRKDAEGNNLFQGGFLGLDNIGVFDRSKPLPTGGFLQQADGTAWMAFYCLTMLSIALELAQENAVYEDLASKFFEHYVHIADAINNLGGTGLWDDGDGFYYDQLKLGGQMIPLRTRSLVGLLPLIAVEVLEEEQIKKLPGFAKRMQWFIEHRPDLEKCITFCQACPHHEHRILAIPSRERLERSLRFMLDESEFLSPYGLRSVSRVHKERPYVFRVGNDEHRVDYTPGEGNTYLFGGNSNWRGPIWFPINYLIIEALERYDHFYGDALKVECPTGSGTMMTLKQVAQELSRRHAGIFLPDEDGIRPCHGEDLRYSANPHWRELALFYEYFHADTGRGCGASHQTGWTSLAVRCLEGIRAEPQRTVEVGRPASRVEPALERVS
ncbi:MAG: MGH1-like glycoside hydrolase domain-containing protein [Verrucomicrobiales bacterium]